MGSMPVTQPEAYRREAGQTREAIYRPAVDIYETAEGITVVADVPGADPGQVEVRLEEDQLLLRAPAPGVAGENESILVQEFVPGVYEREFAIQGQIDAEHIQAELKNGVLRIFLPRAQAAQPRRIPVQTV